MGWQSHRKDWQRAEFTSRFKMAKLKMTELNDSRLVPVRVKEVAMTSTLIVIALLALRVGVPLAVLLAIGEAVRRHEERSVNLRGA